MAKPKTDIGFFCLIALACDELSEYGFITERMQERLRRHQIDPLQVEAGWHDAADIDLCPNHSLKG